MMRSRLWGLATVVPWISVLAICVLASPHDSLAHRIRLKDVLSMSDPAKAALPAEIKRRAVHRFGLKAVAFRRSFLKKHHARYQVTIPEGEEKLFRVRDQRDSGSCWAFATDRVLRSKLYAKGKPASRLSTSFVTYHALRRCAHALLKQGARGPGKPKPSAVRDADEGGYQPWAMEIIRRHGIVPAGKMKFTSDGADPDLSVILLQTLLADARVVLSQLRKDPRASSKLELALADYKRQVDKLLQSTLGKPPKNFKVNGKRYTPRTYARKYLGLKKSDFSYVVLKNNPARKRNRRYKSTKYAGMPTFPEYNVSMAVIERAAIKTLRRGEAVYFGINASLDHPYRAAGKHLPKKSRGILSIAAFNYEDLIPAPELSKQHRIEAKISKANHAMAITGFDPRRKRGGVRKWKVQNSHGRDTGDKGFFHMYNDYFRAYVDEVVVPRSSVPKRLLRKLEKRRIR